jgi:hypothetical protein
MDDFVQGLRYLDRYARSPGGWQFVHRAAVCDWAELRPAFWDLTHPWLAGKTTGKADATDASYVRLRHRIFARHES